MGSPRGLYNGFIKRDCRGEAGLKNPSMPPPRPPRWATYPDPRPVSNKLLIPLSEQLFQALFLSEMKTFWKLTTNQLGATREERRHSGTLHSGLTGQRMWRPSMAKGSFGLGGGSLLSRESQGQQAAQEICQSGSTWPVCTGPGPELFRLLGMAKVPRLQLDDRPS